MSGECQIRRTVTRRSRTIGFVRRQSIVDRALELEAELRSAVMCELYGTRCGGTASSKSRISPTKLADRALAKAAVGSNLTSTQSAWCCSMSRARSACSPNCPLARSSWSPWHTGPVHASMAKCPLSEKHHTNELASAIEPGSIRQTRRLAKTRRSVAYNRLCGGANVIAGRDIVRRYLSSRKTCAAIQTVRKCCWDEAEAALTIFTISHDRSTWLADWVLLA